MLELPGRCYTSTPTFGANNHTLTFPPCMWKRLSRTQLGVFFRFIFRYVNLVVVVLILVGRAQEQRDLSSYSLLGSFPHYEYTKGPVTPIHSK